MRETVRFDSNGVPILSTRDITRRAEDFIAFFDAGCLATPQPTPLGTICDELRSKYRIPILLGVPLGYSSRGHKILGQFEFGTRTISVDDSLTQGDPRFYFTLAHELGHLVLHRRIPLETMKAILGEKSEDTARDLSIDRLDSDSSPNEWLEWQANKFAAALLLPARTVPQALVAHQRLRGIRRGVGRVWVDWRNRALGDFHEMTSHLSSLYKVPRSIVRIRLRELDLLEEEKTPQTAMRIGDILRKMAEDQD